ncbi:MAG: YggT family protein [Actinobacteria bacterium]|nr:YggT family protein [Actinomycetota bacterium]
MHAIGTLLAGLVQLFILAMIVRAVLSWFPADQNSPVRRIAQVLDRLINPILRPLQRLIPPIRLGGSHLDISFIVAILIAQWIILPILHRL